MELRCEVHQLPLQRVERTPALLGRRPEYVEHVPSEDFAAPERVLFPHARPADAWISIYYFCPRCEEAKREWRQRRTASVVEPPPPRPPPKRSR